MDKEGSCKQHNICISVPDPQRTPLFPKFRESTVSRQNEKARVTIDLRKPHLVHLFISENAVWKSHSSNEVIDKNQVLAQEQGSYSKPQTARRGRHFHYQHNARCYSRPRTVRENCEFMPTSQSCLSNSATDSIAANLNSYQILGSSECKLDPSLNLEAPHESLINFSRANSDGSLIFFSNLTDTEKSRQITSDMIHSDSNSCISSSTVIHLMATAPVDTEDAHVSGNSRVLTMPEISCDIAKPAVSNAASAAREREVIHDEMISSEDSSVIDSDDDDLPLIMHCRRKRKAPTSDNETTMKQKVKKTYQRGSMMQHLSNATSS